MTREASTTLPTMEGAGVKRDISVRKRRRQVHLWFSEREYEWLRSEATEHDETVSAVVRRLISLHREQLKRASTDEAERPGPASRLHKE